MMRRIVLSAAWFFGLTVLAGLTLRHWLGDELFVTRYTGYVMPWLLVGLVPGAVWAWLMGCRGLSAVLSVSAAIIVLVYVPLFRRHDPISPASAVTLEIMSFNTWSENGDEGRIARVVLREAPDLLLLQEIPPEVFDRVMVALRGLYDGRTVHFAYEPALQQAVVSRYPLEPRAGMKEKGQAQKVVLRSPAGPITVFNVHPLRDGGWRRRYQQIASLLEEDVLREEAPVILGGDLNATPHSQLHGLITRHLADAHRAAGFGFGFTYPASGLRLLGIIPAPPLVRIDHVFFSDHFVALRAGTLPDSGGSDHRPVLVELALGASTPDVPGLVDGARAGKRWSQTP